MKVTNQLIASQRPVFLMRLVLGVRPATLQLGITTSEQREALLLLLLFFFFLDSYSEL